MILFYMGFGLMTAAAVYAWTLNRRLHKRLSDACNNLLAERIDRNLSLTNKTEVEERDSPIPHFAIYRRGVTDKHDILHVGFNPNDPDDKEYRRIFAEERAEMLNEKP